MVETCYFLLNVVEEEGESEEAPKEEEDLLFSFECCLKRRV